MDDTPIAVTNEEEEESEEEGEDGEDGEENEEEGEDSSSSSSSSSSDSSLDERLAASKRTHMTHLPAPKPTPVAHLPHRTASKSPAPTRSAPSKSPVHTHRAPSKSPAPAHRTASKSPAPAPARSAPSKSPAHRHPPAQRPRAGKGLPVRLPERYSDELDTTGECNDPYCRAPLTEDNTHTTTCSAHGEEFHLCRSCHEAKKDQPHRGCPTCNLQICGICSDMASLYLRDRSTVMQCDGSTDTGTPHTFSCCDQACKQYSDTCPCGAPASKVSPGKLSLMPVDFVAQ